MPAPEPETSDLANPVLIALDEIEIDSLIRDRIELDAAALEELACSILATGLRAPIEVFALPEETIAPDSPLRWGLIAGRRRIAAYRHLAEITGNARWSAIPAFARAPRNDVEAFALMVAENDMRADVSPWERGRIAVRAVEAELFETLEDAVTKLYPAANRARRARIRGAARAVEALDGLVVEPWRLTQRQNERLAAAARAGFAEVMQVALEEGSHETLEGQWRLLEPILAEAETPPAPDAPAPRPGRPRRVLRPSRGLTIRREKTPKGYSLHFTGRRARGSLLESVMDEIERKFETG